MSTVLPVPQVSSSESLLEELRSQALGRLSSDFNHELRNALTGVRCYLELLQTAGLPDSVAGFMGEVDASLDQITTLSSRWSEVARASGLSSHVNSELTRIVNFLRELGVEKRTSFKLDLDKQVEMVVSDPGRLQSVLFVTIAELVAARPTAVEFTSRRVGGNVRITVTSEGGSGSPGAGVDTAKLSLACGGVVRRTSPSGPGFLFEFAVRDSYD